MRKIIVILSLFVVAVLTTNTLQAQEKRKMLGGRLGYPFSISFKQFTSDSKAIELIAGTRSSRYYNSINVGAAYLIHKPIELNDFEGLNYYYGGGASAYFWSYDYNMFFPEDNYSSVSVGVQAYIGLDYSFENTPINLTLDWVPTFFVNGYGAGLGAGFGSLGIRYIFQN